MHPTQDVMVSIGDDCNLIFWEINTGESLIVKDLSNYPTCCQFSPKGDYLVVGFKNGTLMIFEPIINVTRTKKISIEIPGDPLTLKDKETKNAVLNIEFSDNGDLMAVSYDNLKVNREEDDVLKEKEGAFVYVFIKKNSSIKNYKIQAENKCLYDKYTEIRLPSKNETQRVQSNVYGMAIYFMAFSSDNSYLMVYFQRVDNQQIRENRDRNGNYVVWDLSSNNLVTNDTIYNNVQFKKNNFPNHINARYRVLSRRLDFLNGQDKNVNLLIEALQNSEIGISAISNGKEYSYLGSVDGEIFIVKNDFFMFDEVTVPEKLPLSVYCQGKMLRGHVSFVNQVVEKTSKRQKHLFSTGIHDEAIFQWEVHEAESAWELDHFQEYDKQVDDFFLMENDSRQKFDIMVLELHPLRKSIGEIVVEKDENVFPAFSLQLDQILGRRAFNRRKNMWVTKNKEIVYSVGAMIVFVKLQWDRDQIKLKDLQRWEDLCFVSKLEQREEPEDLLESALNKSFISFSVDEDHFQHTTKNDKSGTQSLDQTDNPVNAEYIRKDIELKEALVNNKNITTETNTKNKDESSSNMPECVFIKRVKGFQEKRQRFIDTNIHGEQGVSEEITCLSISPDKSIVCVGVTQQRAHLRLWEVSTGSFKASVSVPNCVTVTHIRYAFDNSTVICVGTTSEYTSCVYLINTSEQRVLALLELKYSLVFKIMDVEFIPNSCNKFLTVGILHCSLWTFNGGVLSFQELELKNISYEQSSFSEDELEEEEEPLEAQPLLASFLCVEFLTEEHFVLGDDKGYLYLFIEFLLDKKLKLHEDQAISVIRKCELNPELFMVGSFGGVLSLFKLFIQEREIDLLLIGQISLFKNAKMHNLLEKALRELNIEDNTPLKKPKSEVEELIFEQSQPQDESRMSDNLLDRMNSKNKIQNSRDIFNILEDGQNPMQREIQSIVFEKQHEVVVGTRSGDVLRVIIYPKHVKDLVEYREAQLRKCFGQNWEDNLRHSKHSSENKPLSGIYESNEHLSNNHHLRLSRVKESLQNMEMKESFNQKLQSSRLFRSHKNINSTDKDIENIRSGSIDSRPLEGQSEWPHEEKNNVFYPMEKKPFMDSDEISELYYKVTVVYSFSDNEIPRACEFSSDSEFIFTISELGLLNVYTLSQLNLVHQQHFHKKTVDMKVTQAHLIIAFEFEVMILKNSGEFEHIQDPISSNKRICYLKVSTDNNLNDWMALAYQQSNEYKPMIEIYKWKSKSFEKLTQFELEHDVHFIDFSVDNLFMLYKDISGNFNFFSLKNHKKIETLGADFDVGIEWQSEGLRLSEKRSAIDR